MTIVFTGGGTGGHFYPIIAIAEAVNDLVRGKQLVAPTLYYLAPDPFDAEALFENRIVFVRVPSGKVRRYFSLQNISDLFITLWGTLIAFITLLRLYPDVLVSKGGYASVPSLLAARVLRIPVVIHESDAKPGRGSLLGARFAAKIAIAFESAATYFPEKTRSKIARTGIPVRKALTRIEPEGARQYLNLEPNIPTIFILGGSQGATRINEAVLSALPDLVAFASVIHQTGPNNQASVESIAKVILAENEHASRYHPFGYLSESAMRRAAGAADIVISRAGAGSIAEIGLWKKPSIIIPIPEAVSHDQRTNAYAYARTGAAIVIEEENLAPHLLVAEAKRILGNPTLRRSMGEAAASFSDPDAANVIAGAVLDIALSHEA
ncbi:MAG: UDP-N-acetylglucosamine--N-acetylmuramyl-(pentapeptide) pyrophosphoryl-undecaprenol N-acetylglucosamine transferase [bacterium]|nr:UDP-N-acetylglucosamine--N-acetylmuramyl-(pentapeptide) pyrophosphoryl-undecaprenol N-acetylglucosamine transferase [bacterium]